MEDANSSFVFETVTTEKFEELITNLNIRNAVQSGYLFSRYTATTINRCITGGTFVNAFKKTEVWPIYERDGWTEKSNYTPISVLSNVSKIYERCIYEQIYSYFDKIFSKNQFGFRKGLNFQHILLAVIEKNESITRWKKILYSYSDRPSKAFDCICYDMLIACLNAYGFDKKALKIIYDYLNGKSQKVKVCSSFSSELDISHGVPPGSILGPLLFHINICDLVFVHITCGIANYADNTTPYECDQHWDNLISNLELTVENIFNWFEYNNLKANGSKRYFLLINKLYQQTSININGSVIKSSNSQKLFGITTNSDFTFEGNINTLCRKASQKLHPLSRISQYLSQHKRQILSKAFIMSQLNCYSLVWMIRSRGLKNKVNNIHKSALKIVYQDKKSNLQDLL